MPGSYDFFAFNHYTSALASDNKFNARSTYRLRDADVAVDFGKEWPQTAAHWCKVNKQYRNHLKHSLGADILIP